MNNQIPYLMQNLSRLEPWQQAVVKSTAKSTKLTDLQKQLLTRLTTSLEERTNPHA